MASCTEKFGDRVEGFIGGSFSKLGNKIANAPRKTILACIVLTALCGVGFMNWSTENRADKLWVPQNTIAETETQEFQSYYQSTSRFNDVIVRASSDSSSVLTKAALLDAMIMHQFIETKEVKVEDETYTFTSLCTKFGGSCASDNKFDGVCSCFILSILKMWDYDLVTLLNDDDVISTLNGYGKREDLEAVLGKPVFDENDYLLSAEAFKISYLIEDRSAEAGSDEAGTEADPINEAWEEEAFLATVESVPTDFPSINVDYFAGRSFSDEFGGAITGDLLLVQISYAVVFIFLGANLGNFKCGTGSRWTMSLAALVTVVLSVGAGFGISSALGFFFGPVHSLLPFILLGIGVDDAFVIVNAFNRERKVSRSSESNADITKRAARALARAGASITVTSATDLVAFSISASSSLPALASFCAYAAIGIFFLWLFASTFFTATLVIDERRQRDNRRECLCFLTRKDPIKDDSDGFKEGFLSRYFRKYHAPAILSKVGKGVVILLYSGLLAFGIWGALNLSVEDTQRSFIPNDSYLTGYLNTADEYYPSTGISLYFVFENGSEIYEKRDELAGLNTRLTGLSEAAPFIAEPVSQEAYRNVMTGLYSYLKENGSNDVGGVTLGDDFWPTTEADFLTTLFQFASYEGPGRDYASDLSLSSDFTTLEAFRVKLEYVKLTKPEGNNVIDDSDKQIEAMDKTRELLKGWDDLPAERFPYSENFIAIEGFKAIRKELFLNVGLALLAVSIIVFITVASPITSILITVNVAFCIIEILGFMHVLGIAIDSVSVINIVLAVGLSIDYSAHVGHCFMMKGGDDKNSRALEALADIGAAVMNGALTTFLAVVVLLFSSSYVFVTLAIQFALTVGLGVTHGLILLPVLLSLLGPKAFSSAELPMEESSSTDKEMTFEQNP